MTEPEPKSRVQLALELADAKQPIGTLDNDAHKLAKWLMVGERTRVALANVLLNIASASEIEQRIARLTAKVLDEQAAAQPVARTGAFIPVMDPVTGEKIYKRAGPTSPPVEDKRYKHQGVIIGPDRAEPVDKPKSAHGSSECAAWGNGFEAAMNYRDDANWAELPAPLCPYPVTCECNHAQDSSMPHERLCPFREGPVLTPCARCAAPHEAHDGIGGEACGRCLALDEAQSALLRDRLEWERIVAGQGTEIGRLRSEIRRLGDGWDQERAELARIKTERNDHLERLVAGDTEAMRQQSIDEIEAIMARAYERCERERDAALAELTRIKEENARLSEAAQAASDAVVLSERYAQEVGAELRKRDAVVAAAGEALKWLMCDDRCLTSSAITIMLDRALSELNQPVSDPAVPVIESES